MLPDMSARLTLHPLTPQDEADVLAFEREQRAFFRGAVGDRGERFFADDPAVHAALLAEAREAVLARSEAVSEELALLAGIASAAALAICLT